MENASGFLSPRGCPEPATSAMLVQVNPVRLRKGTFSCVAIGAPPTRTACSSPPSHIAICFDSIAKTGLVRSALAEVHVPQKASASPKAFLEVTVCVAAYSELARRRVARGQDWCTEPPIKKAASPWWPAGRHRWQGSPSAAEGRRGWRSSGRERLRGRRGRQRLGASGR